MRADMLKPLRSNALQAPEIQTMYTIPLPISTIRTRARQEFERHRFVNKLGIVDVLLVQNNAEYQVSPVASQAGGRDATPFPYRPRLGFAR